MKLEVNYSLVLENKDVVKLRHLLESIPMKVSAEYPPELRKFHQDLYNLVKEKDVE